jgi:8-oxo-dGTP diphosphatase
VGVAPEVRAAGGLVVRERDGRREVAVVHRPRHEDWSLPKGKLEAGEDWAAGALREVEEETGHSAEIEAELDPNRYTDHKGRSKEVRWFRMRPTGGHFVPGDEVDELRWLEPEAATELLDYEHDRRLVRSLRP